MIPKRRETNKGSPVIGPAYSSRHFPGCSAEGRRETAYLSHWIEEAEIRVWGGLLIFLRKDAQQIQILRLRMVGRIMTSKRCPHPNPWNLWDMLPYLSKGTLQRWLQILRWGDFPGLSMWAKCNHKGSYKRKAGGWEPEIWRCYSTGFEDEGRGHKPRNAGSFHKLEKARKQILPRAPRRNAALLIPWFSPVNHISDFWPPKL